MSVGYTELFFGRMQRGCRGLDMLCFLGGPMHMWTVSRSSVGVCRTVVASCMHVLVVPLWTSGENSCDLSHE